MIETVDPKDFDPTTAHIVPESVQYALDKLETLCDEPTFAALVPLATIAPNILLALYALIDIDEAVLQCTQHNFGYQTMTSWVANITDSAIHSLGRRPIMDEATFNKKYGVGDE